MRVVVAGGTGFIGTPLCKRLSQDYDVIALSRNMEEWAGHIDGAYAVVNLAGENIATRWTKEKKQAILQSRLDVGKAVVEAINIAKVKPKVLVQASAVGFYGSREDEVLDETSAGGSGFLAGVAQKWEPSTQEVEALGVRRVIIRTSIVLGEGGGALPQFLKPFLYYVGGPLGNGRQWFAWIHLADEVEAIRFLIERKDLNGVFNLTVPQKLRNKEFSSILGKVMGRPSCFPTPAFVLHLLLGQMADETILPSQRVVPKRLVEAGFKFKYPTAEAALRQILKK